MEDGAATAEELGLEGLGHVEGVGCQTYRAF